MRPYRVFSIERLERAGIKYASSITRRRHPFFERRVVIQIPLSFQMVGMDLVTARARMADVLTRGLSRNEKESIHEMFVDILDSWNQRKEILYLSKMTEGKPESCEYIQAFHAFLSSEGRSLV